MALFGKNNDLPPTDECARDPDKAKKFFEHARTVAESRNYDYAIECLINGLRHEPDNMAAHQSLRDIALKRTVAGGKPAGLTDKFKKCSKAPLPQLMRAEMLWSKDPANVGLLIEVMASAAEADLPNLVDWVGDIVLQSNPKAKGFNKSIYIKARDYFAQVEAFAKAVDACRLALQLDKDNMALQHDLKNLEAERTMQEGGYEEAADEKDGFRKLIKDPSKQRKLMVEQDAANTGSLLDEQIQLRRTEYEDEPEDTVRLQKLISVLLRKETKESEREALELLETASEQTGQYRYKVQIGDIRIKQMNRLLRPIQAQLKADPQNSAVKDQLRGLAQKKIRFELEQFTERVENYPTDLGLRYELGKRLYMTQQFDEAIGSFQQAKSDPKYRVVSLDYLGRCYGARGWLEEAIDTFNQGIEAHHTGDDRLALEMRFQLMVCLRKLAENSRSLDHAQQAQKVASQVLQSDINFRDIRQQMDEIRKLVDDLTKEQR